VPERYWVRLARDVVVARGPEATPFLQGQLSQDLLSIADGGHAWSWLLAPTGKVDALLRVWRVSGDEWVLDTDAGWGEAVLVRLSRFKLRTKVDLAGAPATVVGLRGAGWGTRAEPGPAALVASPPWPGVEGADLLTVGPDDPYPGLEGLAGPALPAQEHEAERILAGIPKMGAELTDKTIPGETGLVPMTVSFTKGCYTGQELVSRIDSRGGNVPRHLRGLRFDQGVEPGSDLYDGDTPIGSVTSMSRSERAGWVGLGYVKRGYEPPHPARAGPERVAAQVVALPS
jgi:folate-binding protein YgfZ